MIEKYALIKVIQAIIREKGEFGLREVARKSSIGPSTAKEALDFLLSHSILEKRVIGRNYLFKIKDTFLTKSIKLLYSLSEINSSKLVESLIERNRDVISVVLYGSVAKGDDDKESDIDILIISRKKIDLSFEYGRLNREVNIINYNYNEWKKKAAEDKVFYYNVILNCVPLYGEKPVVI